MKNSPACLPFAAFLGSLLLVTQSLFAQGTAFTYQGRLNNSGSPANGSYDLKFTLYDANQPVNNLIAGPVTNAATAVSNGLFTVTLDFGSVFNGNARWLEMAVQTNGGGGFTTLSPRQQLTPVPYAVFANAANNVSGTVATTQLSGVVPTSVLPGFQSPNYATVSGGTGNASSAYASVGGGQGNNANNTYATVGGGFDNTAAYEATVGGGALNKATGQNATVPGGFENIASGNYSFAAGDQAQATNQGAFVWADSQGAPFTSTNNDSFNVRAKGGVRLVTSGAGMTLDGQPVITSGSGSGLTIQQNSSGAPNVILGSPNNFVQSGVVGATISGGGATNYSGSFSSATNSVTADFGTVGGGDQNWAGAQQATVSGGEDNAASGYSATVGGGWQNTASGGATTISGGNFNTASATGASVVGGILNVASGAGAFIGGGGYDGISTAGNTASGSISVIAGGLGNIASGYASVTAGGLGNTNNGNYATVPGGYKNLVSGSFAFAAGQQAKATNNGAFVWADSQNLPFASTNNDSFNVRALGGVHFTTSGGGLSVDGQPVLTGSSGSGLVNLNASQLTSGVIPTSVLPGFQGPNYATVSGGVGNVASGNYSMVGGGIENVASGDYSMVGCGVYNVASGDHAVIGGGYNNNARGEQSTIGGGNNNIVGGGNQPTVGGGYGNQATNSYATVPGGVNNIAGGQYSFAAGQQAQAINNGAFVWADSQNATFASTSNDSFNVRAQGGVRFVTSGAGMTLDGPLGTAGSQAFELHVNGSQRALRLEPNGTVTPNLIGGSGYNSVDSGTYGVTIAGGGGNNGSGYTNHVGANANFSVISGGGQNLITAGGAPFSTIGGGSFNTIGANAFNSVISGGVNNTNTGSYADIAGGEYNVAGQNSFAAGFRAQATTSGAFVWSDGTGTTTTSFANNQFMARASGGVVFLTSTAASPTAYSAGTAGASLLPNATSWSTISDRNAKKNFHSVDTEAVLDKLAGVPIQQWNYKWEKDSDVPNVGPMAQDFKHAFYPGRDDKSISTLEFDGVELAAIQGLNQKLERQAEEKDAEIKELRQSVDELKKLVQQLAARR